MSYVVKKCGSNEEAKKLFGDQNHVWRKGGEDTHEQRDDQDDVDQIEAMRDPHPTPRHGRNTGSSLAL